MRRFKSIALALTGLFLLALTSGASGQGITISDIFEDFGPLLERSPSSPSSPTPQNTNPLNPPPDSSSNQSMPPSGNGGIGAQPGSNSRDSTSGEKVVYQGEWVTESRLAFESFFEQVIGETLKFHEISNVAVRSRKVDVDVTRPAMRMVVEGGVAKIDPLSVTIDLSGSATMETGRTETTKQRIIWSMEFEPNEFIANSEIQSTMTLTARTTDLKSQTRKSPPARRITGTWSATPLSRDRYNIVVVFDAHRPNPESMSESASSAFSSNPKSWNTLVAQTKSLTGGYVQFPSAPKQGQPRWILEPVDGSPSPDGFPPGTSPGPPMPPNPIFPPSADDDGSQVQDPEAYRREAWKILEELNLTGKPPESEDNRERSNRKPPGQRQRSSEQKNVGNQAPTVDDFFEEDSSRRDIRIEGPIPDENMELLDIQSNPRN
jgi:hypothetical protein